jgi:hypothetical protein
MCASAEKDGRSGWLGCIAGVAGCGMASMQAWCWWHSTCLLLEALRCVASGAALIDLMQASILARMRAAQLCYHWCSMRVLVRLSCGNCSQHSLV